MNIDLSPAIAAIRDLIEGTLARLPSIGIAFLLFILFAFFAAGVRASIRKINDRLQRHRNVGLVLGRLAQGAILLIGLLVALVVAVPGFQPGQLIQVLGLSTVAIGFAFQDILKNFLAGILILISQPFRIGDQIVAQGGKYEGTVEEIQTRATFLRTYDGRRVVIPNADLFSDSVVVNTAFHHLRLEYNIGIGGHEDLEHAKTVILNALRKVDSVLPEPPPEVLLLGIGDWALNLRVRWWTSPPAKADVLATQDVVLRTLVNALRPGRYALSNLSIAR